MKIDISKVCAVCNGSGMISTAIEYPDPANQRWCSSCESGRAKAEHVAEIVRGTLAGRRPVAA